MGKKHEEEHENHERWIIPYADMVTLLFAFFVVMYAMSQQDLAKLKNMSKSLKESFMGFKEGGAKKDSSTFAEGNPEAGSTQMIVKKTVTNEELVDDIKNRMKNEEFDLVFQDGSSAFRISISERGVVISMSAGYLFDENSTEIRQDLVPVMQVLADIMKSNNRLLSIEGHTDDAPVIGDKYYSNWELSVLRATSTARLFIDQFGIDPMRITAAGFGKYRPIAPNDTKENRSKNRRVDIVMLNSERIEDRIDAPDTPR